jgi:hypothetical protein
MVFTFFLVEVETLSVFIHDQLILVQNFLVYLLFLLQKFTFDLILVIVHFGHLLVYIFIQKSIK